MNTLNNPLLAVGEVNSLPVFSSIKAEQVVPALKQVITDNKKHINQLVGSGSRHESLHHIIQQLQQLENRLERVWSPVKHLNAVMNTTEIRQAYTACLPLLSAYSTELGQHQGLYRCLKTAGEEVGDIKGALRAVYDNYMKNFTLAGIHLTRDKQKRYKALSSELSRLQSAFSDNVLDATQGWSRLITDKTELRGLPPSALGTLKTAARQKGLEGWLLTLDYPVYHAVITYADDSTLREEMYTRFCTRASDQSDDHQYDNSFSMQRILNLRTQRAKLLGFEHYAEQSLYKKMAANADEVITFLTGLLAKVKPQAEQEMKELKQFATDTLSLPAMQIWDQAYVAEKLKQVSFAYKEEEIKPWFSVDQVLNGLFDLVKRLYGYSVRLQQDPVDCWHPDVKVYEILDKNGKAMARFYLDLYSRENKRGGAWMDALCGRFKVNNERQLPVAYLTCNLTPPDESGKPALFTHNEVITLFHEFGHGLHHMLTQADYLDVSGINGVEWDAVELPSQFMENWCWEKASLDLFARHYESGTPLPDELYQKMLKTRHFNSALSMLRQLEFALFDMYLHTYGEVKKYQEISDILKSVRQQTTLLPVPSFNRFQNSFSHIFSGGYAAGYYSYLWAEVLSADAFGKFEETGLFNQSTARQFLTEILEKGGSRPARESFIQYRGREPDIGALLRHSGIH